ncbi:MAG TPA: hypothetical protein VG797_05255 [Phycisphaerales bacterium]|nr:hypothetical protein [Phycisphaerales bacterium]
MAGHEVKTAHEMGWASLGNGELVTAAEASFDVMITTDQNLRYQQNLAGRRLAILILSTTSWPRIQRNLAVVVEAIAAVEAGAFSEVVIPE